MKTTHSIHKNIWFLVIAVFGFVLLGSVLHADEYGFEKKDKSSEEAKYLAKLTSDRKKVELAPQHQGTHPQS